MRFTGTVTNTEVDEAGCLWASLDIEVHADDRLATTCAARIAVPADENDNPWARKGDDWRP